MAADAEEMLRVGSDPPHVELFVCDIPVSPQWADIKTEAGWRRSVAAEGFLAMVKKTTQSRS